MKLNPTFLFHYFLFQSYLNDWWLSEDLCIKIGREGWGAGSGPNKLSFGNIVLDVKICLGWFGSA